MPATTSNMRYLQHWITLIYNPREQTGKSRCRLKMMLRIHLVDKEYKNQELLSIPVNFHSTPESQQNHRHFNNEHEFHARLVQTLVGPLELDQRLGNSVYSIRTLTISESPCSRVQVIILLLQSDYTRASTQIQQNKSRGTTYGEEDNFVYIKRILKLQTYYSLGFCI